MGNDLVNTSEVIIWNQFLDGNEQAYSFIYQYYAPILFKYGMKISSDRELVKDAIQDVFVYLWDAKERLSRTDSIKYYLFRVVRRVLFAKINKMQFSSVDTPLDVLSLECMPSFEYHLIEEQTIASHHKKLSQEIEHLPLRQKEAVFLRFYNNLEFEEVARLMNISQRAVYKLIYKAVHALQKNMLTSISVVLTIALLFFSFSR
jgi:RNA polymerase sigma-70 factor (ECF subfamily)